MGRNRKKKNQQLPKYVYLSKGRYVYKTYLGNGQFGKEIVLAKGDAPLSKVHQEYERLLGRTSNTLYWLVNKFLDSKQFKEKRKNTQIAYEKYARTLLKTKLSNGKLFGDVDISRITQKVIRKYLDSRSRKKVYANRHVQFLKAVFNWGRERFDDVTDNPCQGVKLYREKPRQRYIEDQEYELVLNLATGYIPLFMELSYLCRARRTEIIHMELADIKEEGVHLRRAKGSKDEVTLWTSRLEKVIRAAKRYHKDVISSYLIHDKDGLPIQEEAFTSAWQRLMKRALKHGLKERFTFHDIKAKGVSDHEKKHSGHHSDRMKRVYDRKVEHIESTR